jgi:dTDP-4-dehydrorhamnose reductase
MAENKIAILGGRGMLGSDLVGAFEEQGIETAVFDLPEFDITNHRQLTDALSDVSMVVNCAAYTNVDGAETQYELAYKINAEAVGQLGLIAKDIGLWVLHISTDFIFDGKSNRPYVETDTPNPINKYGKTKLAGEKLLIESGCNHCIIRLEWTYGLNGRNFINKLLDNAKVKKQLKVVDDQIGSPTATTEAAKAICTLVKKKQEGIFHFASSGYVSRFDMAKFVFDKLNVSVDLKSCKTGEFPAPAERPLNSCFDCAKIEKLLDEPIEPWQGPLERFLK